MAHIVGAGMQGIVGIGRKRQIDQRHEDQRPDDHDQQVGQRIARRKLLDAERLIAELLVQSNLASLSTAVGTSIKPFEPRYPGFAIMAAINISDTASKAAILMKSILFLTCRCSSRILNLDSYGRRLFVKLD